MNRLLFFILLATLMFSCSKDFEEINSSSSVSTRDRDSESTCDVSYSFTVGETSNLQVMDKPFEEFCQVDMMNITSSYQTSKTVNICHNDRGQSCLTIENNSNLIKRDRESDKNEFSLMTVCDDVATVTTNSGTTETFEIGLENTIFHETLEGIISTQEQKDSTLHVMIDNAIIEGAEIEQDDSYLIIKQPNSDGTITKTFYDKVNHIILYTETVDQNGDLISKSIHQYVCVGGYILPDVILNIDINTTAICDDSYIRKTILKFDDYDVIVK